MGSMLGVRPDEADVPAIALTAAGEAGGPLAARGVAAATRGVGDTALNLLGTAAGVGDNNITKIPNELVFSRTADDMVRPGVNIPGGKRIPLGPKALGKFNKPPTLEEAALRVEEGLDGLMAKTPEGLAVESILRRNVDKPVSLTPVIRELMPLGGGGSVEAVAGGQKVLRDMVFNVLGAREGIGSQPLNAAKALASQARKIASDDNSLASFLSNLTPEEANIARRVIDKTAFKAPETTGGRLSSETVAAARVARSTASGLIKTALRGETAEIAGKHVEFTDLMGRMAETESAIGVLGQSFGGARQPQGIKKGIAAVKKAFDPDNPETLRAIELLDQRFPQLNLKQNVEQAARGSLFGPGGVPSTQARLTMTGNIMGAGLIGGGVLAGSQGDHPILGGGLGLLTASLLFSPAGVTRLTAAGRGLAKPFLAGTDILGTSGKRGLPTRQLGKRVISSAVGQAEGRSVAPFFGGPSQFRSVPVDAQGNPTDEANAVSFRLERPEATPQTGGIDLGKTP